MIVFKTLTIQNFLSYGNGKNIINLNCDHPTLVTGINYDASVNGELDSNGCGKSTILNALSYVLYNKAISISENLDQLINNINQKDMLVTLIFTKDKTTYRIKRFRKNKSLGGNGVLIEEKKGKTWKDITSTKPEIQISESILQIPFTVFNRIIGYAAGEKPFLKMGLPEQREVIDELFEYTELTKRANKIKELMKGLKKDLEYARESNQSIKEEAHRHKEQYNSMLTQSKTWESSKAEALEKMEVDILDLSSVDYSYQKELLNAVNDLEDNVSKISGERNQLEKDIKQLEEEQTRFENFDSDKSAKIKIAKKTHKDALIENFSEEEQRKLISSKIKLKDIIDNLQSEITSLTKDERKKMKNVNDLSGQLSHLEDAKCPYCMQKYEDAEEKIKEIRKELKNNERNLNEIENEIKGIEVKLQEYTTELEEAEDRLLFDSESDIVSYTNGLERLQEKIHNLENQDNPYNDKTKEIMDAKKALDHLVIEQEKIWKKYESERKNLTFESESELASSLAKLESLKERLIEKEKEENPYIEIINNLEEYEPKENKDEEIENLENKILHCDFLIKLLTKKDSYLRKALMDKYLPMLNKRLHHYLNLMALPHKVVFNSDLTTEISQFDTPIPYGNLSAGQRARINIALSLSFRDVLQSKHNFINLFILDECLDVGLSNVGVRKTVKAIKEVAKTNKLSMFVISHRDEAKESFSEKLEIELRNGFSTIKKED